jgi:predicted nucleic acid-binding protein
MGIAPLLIYLDSCIIIYLVEQHPIFAPRIKSHLATRQPGVLLAFSALSELECLVMPLRLNNPLLLNKFRDWFQNAALYLPLERNIARQAAQLRATHTGLKTPDALHLATAQHYGCSEFWTNDDRLRKVAPLLARNIC